MKPTNRKSWTGNLLRWSDLILGPLLQGQMRIAKLKSLFKSLLLKNAVHLRIYVSCSFPVDTSCIWPQMRPWSSSLME